MNPGLGDILLSIGLIDDVQLASVLQRQAQWGGHLLTHLVQSRMVPEERLVEALARRFQYEAVHPLPMLIETPVLKVLPGDFCAQALVLPLAQLNDKTVRLAVADPSDLSTLDTARAKIGKQVTVVVGGPKSIAEAVQSHYFGEEPPVPGQLMGGELLDPIALSAQPQPQQPSSGPAAVELGPEEPGVAFELGYDGLGGASAADPPAAQQVGLPDGLGSVLQELSDIELDSQKTAVFGSPARLKGPSKESKETEVSDADRIAALESKLERLTRVLQVKGLIGPNDV